MQSVTYAPNPACALTRGGTYVIASTGCETDNQLGIGVQKEESIYPFESPEELRGRFEGTAFVFMDALYRTALRMSGNCHDAEDLVQETYLRAYRYFHRFQPDTNLKAWLFRILVNVFNNEYRRRARQPITVPLDGDDPDGFSVVAWVSNGAKMAFSPSAESEALDGLVDEEVKQALSALPRAYRLVVLLADVEDLSYREIAEALGLKMGTVMSRLHRGRRLLQGKLAHYVRQAGYEV